MRHKLKSGFVLLVAVLALGAVGVSSASAALPEFREAKFPETFTGSGGQFTMSEGASGSFSCKSSTITGAITSHTEVAKVVIEFHCQFFCKNSGTFQDEVLETKELKGRIAYLEKAKRKVGLLLEPVAGPVANCQYAGAGAEILGSVIPEITASNGNKLTLTFKRTQEKQQWLHFEGEEATHNLELAPVGLGSRQIALETTMTLTVPNEVVIAK
jgi:hypothetical protein